MAYRELKLSVGALFEETVVLGSVVRAVHGVLRSIFLPAHLCVSALIDAMLVPMIYSSPICGESAASVRIHQHSFALFADRS